MTQESDNNSKTSAQEQVSKVKKQNKEKIT